MPKRTMEINLVDSDLEVRGVMNISEGSREDFLFSER